MFFQQIKENFGTSTVKLLKSYISNYNDIRKFLSRKEFLLNCRKANLHHNKINYNCNKLNNGMHFFSKSVNKRYKNLCTKLKSSLLKLEIKDTHNHIKFLYKKCFKLEAELKSLLPDEIIDKIIIQEQSLSFKNSKTYKSLQNKFFSINSNSSNCLHNENSVETNNNYDKNNSSNNNDNHNFINTNINIDNITLNKHNCDPSKDPWIKNLTNITIPKKAYDLVRLGETFSNSNLANKNEHVIEIMKDIECNLKNVPYDEKEKLKNYVLNLSNNYLDKFQKVTSFDSLIKESLLELKSFLKNNPDLFFSKSDKGNTTVLLNHNHYTKCVEKMLNDNNTYQLLDTDPSEKLSKLIFKFLNNLRLQKYLGPHIERKHIQTSECILARAYALAKTHKIPENLISFDDIKFRLVVSSIDSHKCYLSKLYEQILSESIKKPTQVIKNSQDFINKIKNIKIPDNYIMVSLDVVNMYPSIPFDLIKSSIKNRWEDIKKCTDIPLKEFLSGLDLLLNTTYFKFNNKFYKQIFGLPMGDPSSPILGELAFYDLENSVLNSFDFDILFYGRYVDDTFLIIPKDKLQTVFNTFNKFHPRIQFTIESEDNHQLNFLDINIHRDNQGNIFTNWYRKKSYSGRLLNYLSDHPIHQKIAIIKNLTDKAINLSHPKFHKENLKFITEILILNNYPKQFIQRHINNRVSYIKSIINSSSASETDKPTFSSRNIFKLPHIKNFSNKIHNFTKKYQLNTIYHIPFKLNRIIKLGKDKLNKEQQKNVVYCVKCKDCDKKYIGQTGRLPSTRILDEHKNNYHRSATYHNVMSLHQKSTNNEHTFDFDGFEILHKEPNTKKRELMEMMYIKKHQKTSVNKKTDLNSFSPPYEILLNKII